MKSIIICEGSTDFALLQYFMRKVYNWEDSRLTTIRQSTEHFKVIRTFTKGEDILSIGGGGGSGRIITNFEYVLDVNQMSSQMDMFHRIVVVTDRDEIGTEAVFVRRIEEIFEEKGITISESICNDRWITCVCENGHGREITFQVLLLVIPFEDTGAMETFLLNALAMNDSYDAEIISKCNYFVDTIDYERRYLNRRRYITKSKYDVYFSVRTAADQFVERHNILKNIPWEEYTYIQTSFQKLADLSS